MSELASDKFRKPSPARLPSGGQLQRKCDCGTHTVAGGKCDTCMQKSESALGRSSAGHSHAGSVPPVVGEVLNSPGSSLDAGTRTFMETRFNHDFSRVRVHSDARASESARAVNSLAYTVGDDIVFDSGQYAPASGAGRGLLAHELAHVVQQRRTGASAQAKATDISRPGDAAERRADAAADAVTGGRQVPDVGDAAGGTLHRAVRTNGGEFRTTAYFANNDASAATPAGVGKNIGAHINLHFKPVAPVLADTIGMVQTVKTMRSTAAGGPVTTPGNARTIPDLLGPDEADPGRGIDQIDFVDSTTIPQTNPLYATTNTATTISTSLTDIPADPANGWGEHGHRKSKAGGGFDVKDAILDDTPGRTIEFAGQQYTQSFEVTALVLDGPMANTYLGSVAWGWKNDAAGNATLDPTPISFVSAGVPSTAFAAAAEKWNKMKVTDPTSGTAHETVDLPTVTDDLNSGLTAAADRRTSNLIAWINVVNFQISGLKAGTDRTNKEFEKRALETELAKRNIEVQVNVRKTEDAGADEVYVVARRGKRSVRSGVRDINDRQKSLFTLPLANLLPIDGPITIEVYDEDVVSDDQIVKMDWTAFHIPAENTKSAQGADYRVKVKFDK